MNYTLFVLFMLFAIVGCNTEMADLGRISSRPSKIIQFGSSANDVCNDVVIDSFENIICVGSTQGSLARASDGSHDSFVAKLDRNGKVLWIVQLQSDSAGNDSATSVGIDSSNNIYVGGTTNGRIGTGAILNKQFVNPVYVWVERLVTATDVDGYVAKFSPEGQIQWVKQFGSVSDEACNNIAVSLSGNSYCGAFTNGELGTDAATGMDEYLGGTAFNPIVAKIDKNGNMKWIRQFGVISQPGQWGAEDKCTGIAIDDDENVYCGGYTYGSLTDTNGGGQDLMVWMLDKNGYTQRITQIGTTAAALPQIGDVTSSENCEDIIVDKQKNVYCSVTTDSAFGPGEAGGNYDVTLMKWNSAGSVEWVKQLGTVSVPLGYDSSADEFIQGLNIDSKGNVIASGYTTGSTVAPLKGITDLLVASFSPTGNVNWIKQYGSTGNENCVNVVSDSAGNVYCSGPTTGTFGATSSGAADAIILRVDPLGNL